MTLALIVHATLRIISMPHEPVFLGTHSGALQALDSPPVAACWANDNDDDDDDDDDDHRLLSSASGRGWKSS